MPSTPARRWAWITARRVCSARVPGDTGRSSRGIRYSKAVPLQLTQGVPRPTRTSARFSRAKCRSGTSRRITATKLSSCASLASRS